MESITIAQLPALFSGAAKRMEEMAGQLCEMDARLGDGDLGLTMKKGFGALPGILSELNEADIGKTLAKAGMKLSSVAPSTMGTLMASGLMGGGKALAGKTEMDAPGFSLFLNGFCEGIVKRGKCQAGDRTLLDALEPAAQAAAASVQKGASLQATYAAALAAAKDGVEATRAMTPKFGKAAVHAAAAVGLPDQGACAAQYMLEGLGDFILQ